MLRIALCIKVKGNEEKRSVLFPFLYFCESLFIYFLCSAYSPTLVVKPAHMLIKY